MEKQQRTLEIICPGVSIYRWRKLSLVKKKRRQGPQHELIEEEAMTQT